MSLPTTGVCIDLETTITARIPDTVRPAGKKRYETRILEIGLVDWQQPDATWGTLVNPIPSDIPIASPKDLFDYLIEIHQNPTRTLQFWSKVLVKRKSLTRDMFRVSESPEVWLARGVQHKCKDFVRWHNNPSCGPKWLDEKQALLELMKTTRRLKANTWLAHNGNSFDFKVLQGCAIRHGVVLDESIQKLDTLRHFRKHIPGHKSYSQPILYKAIFNEHYNAHVAIDDAKALARLCKHVHNNSTQMRLNRERLKPTPERLKPTPERLKPAPVSVRKKMELTFRKSTPVKPTCSSSKLVKHLVRSGNVTQLRGVGVKTAGALAVLGIDTVQQFHTTYKQRGDDWLRQILPAGVRWRAVSKSLNTI